MFVDGNEVLLHGGSGHDPLVPQLPPAFGGEVCVQVAFAALAVLEFARSRHREAFFHALVRLVLRRHERKPRLGMQGGSVIRLCRFASLWSPIPEQAANAALHTQARARNFAKR